MPPGRVLLEIQPLFKRKGPKPRPVYHGAGAGYPSRLRPAGPEENIDFKLEKKILLLPNRDDTDGFFIAKIVKEA